MNTPILSVISFNVCGQHRLYNILTTRDEILTTIKSPYEVCGELRKALVGYQDLVEDALDKNAGDQFGLFLTTGHDVFYVGTMNNYETIMDAINQYTANPLNKIPVGLV